MEDQRLQAAPLAEAILDQLADAVIYTDRQGIIERWNAAAASLFGHTAVEAIGQNLDLIIPEHLRAAHWRGFDAALASGATKLHGRPMLTRAQHQSGEKLYVEMSFALVADRDGQIVGSVAMARDVTARVEKDREIARELAEARRRHAADGETPT